MTVLLWLSVACLLYGLTVALVFRGVPALGRALAARYATFTCPHCTEGGHDDH